GPIYAVQPGMGETILIQVFVVIVIGGIGCIRGAMVGAIVVGIADTLGRAFLKPMLAMAISPPAADKAGPALASMLIYLLVAAVRFSRPEGLFPARSRSCPPTADVLSSSPSEAPCWRWCRRSPRSPTSRSTSTSSGA